MANSGYDVVVDVDDEGDLGHTDLADLEFHQSSNPFLPYSSQLVNWRQRRLHHRPGARQDTRRLFQLQHKLLLFLLLPQQRQ